MDDLQDQLGEATAAEIYAQKAVLEARKDVEVAKERLEQRIVEWNLALQKQTEIKVRIDLANE